MFKHASCAADTTASGAWHACRDNQLPVHELHGMIGLMAGMHLRQDLVWVRTTCLAQGPRYVLQITTVQHKQMFVPHQQLPSPNMGMLDSGQQFATAPPGGFLGSKRASAMQQAVSR